MLRSFMFSLRIRAMFRSTTARRQLYYSEVRRARSEQYLPGQQRRIQSQAREEERGGNEKGRELRACRGRPSEIAVAAPCDAGVHGRRRSGRGQPRQDHDLQPAVRGDVAHPAASPCLQERRGRAHFRDRKSTRLNSSHQIISYAVFCLKKKKNTNNNITHIDTVRD